MIQFDIGNSTSITGVLHAVIECGNGMLIGRIIRIVVDDAGNTVLAILAIDTINTLFSLDDGRSIGILTVFTLFASLADKADGTIFTGLAILTIMAEDNII